MGKDDFYVDDSECTENNYRTKKIDAPIPCGVCEYLGFSKNVVPDTAMYSCKKQNPNRWDDDLNRLYRGCPLPKPAEKPELLSRIQKIEGAITNLSGLLCEKIEKVESRVTLVEKCVQELIDERDESIRYENFDRLQAENAKLKERNEQLKRDFNTEAQGYHETIQGLLGEKAIADKLRCENEKLEKDVEFLKASNNWQSSDLNKMIEINKKLYNEKRELKANQLSKEEIEIAISGLQELHTKHIGVNAKKWQEASNLYRKLESMVAKNDK